MGKRICVLDISCPLSPDEIPPVNSTVSTDAGKNWKTAAKQDPVLNKAHTRLRYLWHWDGGETEILSRAIDETGYTQPTLQQLVAARGKDMGGYHLNPITAWLVKRDGTVLFRPERWK